MTAISTARGAHAGNAAPARTPFWLRGLRHELGKFRPRNRPFYRRFKLPQSLESELLRFDHDMPADRHGRCPIRKMQAMAGLIVEHELRSAVEIGVYRGSSLLPQAMAMRRTGGRAVGIDPYSMAKWRQKQAKDEAEAPPGEEYETNVAEIQWDRLYQELLSQISRHGLEAHCTVIRGLSFDVASEIETGVDMLHIDGNHDFDSVERDLREYLPKLKTGGFLVMDDITWQGVAPHYGDLKQTMPVVWETVTWAILRKT